MSGGVVTELKDEQLRNRGWISGGAGVPSLFQGALKVCGCHSCSHIIVPVSPYLCIKQSDMQLTTHSI
jgi:hypothetical protein